MSQFFFARLSSLRRAASALIAVCVVLVVTSADAQRASKEAGASIEAAKPNRITIRYEEPANSLDQPLFDQLKVGRVLEKLQAFFSPIRLPRPLLLRLAGCEGEANAYYDRGVVTVCVETVYDMVRLAQQRRPPEGLTQRDIVLGGFFHVFLHEVSHAVFDYLAIPILEREEDAADQLAAYVVLNLEKEDARKLIAAAIYLYADDAGVLERRRFLPQRSVRTKLSDLAGSHSTPAQRLYNMICLAYGSDQRTFQNAVTSGALPRERASGCPDEYEQAANAYRKLILPHIDLELGRLIKTQRWLSLTKPQPKPAQ